MVDGAATNDAPATLAELLSSARSLPPGASSYLSDLTSLSLPALLSEPTTLSSTSAQLTNALTTLCTASYPTFLGLHASSSSLSSTLSTLGNSLSSLLITLPDLQTSAQSFSSTAAPLLSTRRGALLVRDRSSALSDVLELPRLIDASIRHGAYGDALDLAQHAQQLSSRFPELPLVQDVAAECASAQRTLLAQLLAALTEPGRARLPALFRACSFVRRMAVLSEPELALAFLAGRLAALNDTLGVLEQDRRADPGKDASPRFLRKFVDSWREGIQDGVAQFSTIFLERSPALSVASPSSPLPSSVPAINGPESSTPAADDPILRHLISRWTGVLLSNLLTTFTSHLSAARLADPSSAPALLTQLSYAALACARLGLDFRPALAAPFRAAVASGFSSEMAAAQNSLQTKIETVKKRRLAPSKWMVIQSLAEEPPTPDSDDDDDEGKEKEKKPPHAVPQIIASYPPLAELTNALLTALNGLRLLAPRAALPAVLQAQDACLASFSRALLTYTQEAVIQGGEAEEKVLRASGKVLVRELVPFMRRALVEGVFGLVVGPENGRLLTKASGEAAKVLKEVLGAWEEWLDEGEEEEEEEEDAEDGTK